MNKELMFSSASDDWATPQYMFDALHKEFKFGTDVCASSKNAKCEKFYDNKADGLKQTWTGSCWMNPPYGRRIGDWVRKAHQSAKAGATVVCLLPARTDTKWFHEFCVEGEVRLLKGRIKFNGHKASAPFPSMVVVFSPTIKPVIKASWQVRLIKMLKPAKSKSGKA